MDEMAPLLLCRVMEVFDRIELMWRVSSADSSVTYIVLSPLAEGADRLVVKGLDKWTAGRKDRQAELVVALPLPTYDYAQDFTSPESMADFLHLMEGAKEVLTIESLPNRQEAFAAVGRFVVDRCDVLIAIWNGNGSAEKGGTADTVSYARSISRPIFWIHADTGEIKEEPGKMRPTGS
jgi:hypothetical protein